MRETISGRMSDRVLLCMGGFQLHFLAKKAPGGRSWWDEMIRSYLPGNQ